MCHLIHWNYTYKKLQQNYLLPDSKFTKIIKWTNWRISCNRVIVWKTCRMVKKLPIVWINLLFFSYLKSHYFDLFRFFMSLVSAHALLYLIISQTINSDFFPYKLTNFKTLCKIFSVFPGTSTEPFCNVNPNHGGG